MNYDKIASPKILSETEKALADRGFLPETVATGADALARIKELIPKGASVMNGSSRTLDEIGFVNYLKEGNHGWNNVHAAIVAEKDPAKQAALRGQATLSDYYLGSVHAVSQAGELFIASNSGSQLPHVAFTSKNIIFVVGAQKIEPDFNTAMSRIRDYVLPLEDDRMKSTGAAGSFISKLLVLYKEQPWSGRKVHVIFVNQKLGF